MGSVKERAMIVLIVLLRTHSDPVADTYDLSLLLEPERVVSEEVFSSFMASDDTILFCFLVWQETT